MPAPILVEMHSPQPEPQELAVLIAACTRAATPNACIGAEKRSSESPLGVAIVRRDGDRARIELGLRSVVSAEWSTRDLVFQPGDDELERYRAIGFAIGTLVARRLEPEAPATSDTQPPTPEAPISVAPAPRDDAVPRPRARPLGRGIWLDLAGGVGLGLVPGPPRAGGALRAASDILPGGLFGTAELGYAERTADSSLRVRWLSLGVGIGHPLGLRLRSLGVDGRLLIMVERVSFTAVDGTDSDTDASWKPGMAAAIDAHWEALPPLSLVVSAATFVDPRRTVLKTRGAQVGETPALGLGGFLGLRLKLR
ncbi:MAG TPA: hypothetical protein VJN18_14275 [Polyangiaceae bacterium]|nr:hypothetical protein [Polyangiaceae bacterium]